MSSTATVDARPVDYREGRLCAVYLAPDVRADLDVDGEPIVRIRTERDRSVLCRVVPSSDEPGSGSLLSSSTSTRPRAPTAARP